ncbi:UBX domain-containing 1, partial [Paramuricea clavata]
SDDFLVLPEGVHLDEVKATLDTVNVDNVQANPDTNTKLTTSQQQPPTSSVLKLRGSADSSMFDETVKADMTLLSYMKEMGFDVAVAEKALLITKNQGVQPAIDWINSNPDKVTEIQMAQFHQPSTPSETVVQEKIGDNRHAHPVATTSEAGPVSRYQTTIDERHRFQERVRLEAIEAARLEKAEQKRQKQYLLKNLEDEKKERREK